MRYFGYLKASQHCRRPLRRVDVKWSHNESHNQENLEVRKSELTMRKIGNLEKHLFGNRKFPNEPQYCWPIRRN